MVPRGFNRNCPPGQVVQSMVVHLTPQAKRAIRPRVFVTASYYFFTNCPLELLTPSLPRMANARWFYSQIGRNRENNNCAYSKITPGLINPFPTKKATDFSGEGFNDFSHQCRTAWQEKPNDNCIFFTFSLPRMADFVNLAGWRFFSQAPELTSEI